jgi:hypothetical protein
MISKQRHVTFMKVNRLKYYMGVSGVPRNFVRGGGSTTSDEDRGQGERGSGGGSPLVRDSAQFANE